MSFLAEILAVMIVWLSSLALGQFGVAVDNNPKAKPAKERVVTRSPRVSPPPVAIRAPDATPAAM
jgi:hypothetical protein